MHTSSTRQRVDHLLIGEDPEIRRLVKAARVVAATDVSVLLLGENGTGKELLARNLHRWSSRGARPFLAIHCAGLDEMPDLPAICERAGGHGTLLLDEVAELPPRAQAGLLRYLDALDGGCRVPAPRLIATTDRDLSAAVASGAFRRDLYHRLCVVPLTLPPLRRRTGDIPLLLEHFLSIAARTHRLKAPKFTTSAVRLLRRYPWPGNLRELRNLCERLVILLPGAELTPHSLPPEVRAAEAPAAPELLFRLPETGIDLEQLEASAIRQALELAGGNKSRAARLLGLTRYALQYRIRKRLDAI